jgi:transcriptional regulator with AAA-type ATPase domain
VRFTRPCWFTLSAMLRLERAGDVRDDSTLGDDLGAGLQSSKPDLELCWWATEGQSGRLELTRSLTFGRDAGCDVCIPTASTSRKHARIDLEGAHPVLRDLASRNGVFVDGQRIEAKRLERGNVVRIGGGVGVVVTARCAQHGEFRELAPGLWGGVALARVADHARLAARSGLNIVLEAESGSGKECFARAIHEWSARSGPLVPVNCSAVPTALAEAELFGYQRGAFTGAERNHAGYFKAASGGTLFLDEVLELPAAVQAKLLRAAETREVVPLGATQAVRVAIRIVSACQVPMAQAVHRGQLRADLFARLNGVTIRIPPLRERREDILPLFQHFLTRFIPHGGPQIGPLAAEALCLHDWPLNVRELETVALRASVFFPGAESIGAEDVAGLMGRLLSEMNPSLAPAHDGDPAWEKLVGALTTKRGNVVKAAEAVGISRQRAYRLMAQHPELDVAQLRRMERCRH